MKIRINNKLEIKQISKVGDIVAKTLIMIEKYIKEGITTNELNTICHNYIVKKLNAIPSPLNYKGFPKSICISINDQVCHGIPSNRKLKKNDILNIDITINKNGFFADSSKMFIVNNTKNEIKKLLKVSQQSLYEAIKIIKPNININKIGKTIENYIKKYNYTTVKEFCGHGIGKKFHEEPQILHYKNNYNNIILKNGKIFTIDTMINMGKSHIFLSKNKWTVQTKDNSMSSQWEHTILVTNNGYDILTYRKEEQNNIKKSIY